MNIPHLSVILFLPCCAHSLFPTEEDAYGRPRHTGEERMFRNRYVHRDIIKAWSDDARHVSFYNPLTKEEPGERELDSLYYFDYPKFESGTAEKIDRLEDFLSLTISALNAGNLGIIRDANEAGRSSLLFQHTRLPFFNKIDYLKYGVKDKSPRTLKEIKGRDYFSSDYDEICAGFLKRVANLASGDSIALMDLNAALLVPPSGMSFIIGPSAFNAMNPYFEKRFVKCPYVDKAYDIKGAVLVLPFEPEKALMLYDPSVYEITSGSGSTVALTPSDTDILNMVQIYNSDIDGVIYKGDKDDLDRLTALIGTPSCRDGYEWLRGDRFPFSTLLSFVSVRDKAQRDLKKNVNSPLRPFVRAMREYDSMYAMPADRKTFYNRYLFAESLISDR